MEDVAPFVKPPARQSAGVLECGRPCNRVDNWQPFAMRRIHCRPVRTQACVARAYVEALDAITLDRRSGRICHSTR